ncbi:MAG: DEAD/DEAH box helicase family protein [Candidatus Poribacteria bacterium]|nr:DEAD/DEAH box helicase family protein [Candidatus Poribacteria bacterium]
MPEQFLYQQLDAASNLGLLNKEIPDSITQNLNPAYELRDYQKEAFARFIHCHNGTFPGKENPLHLLFNMATGSGKTLIMAGLILYLYEQGYHNFLFFVNSTNIIEKTRDNFLNPRATKYLFNENIYIDGKKVAVTEVNNFDGVNENDINICFTTIQQLRIDMTTEKENALTYENFAEQEIVLLADEAHHMNTKTKTQQELFESWENTVERIFKSNEANLLLEFTATHDYETAAMVEKYRNKVINRYDLIDFRRDKFSKEIDLVYFDMNTQTRMLQALILSYYKQKVAVKYKIPLDKPVILFKEKSIPRSKENRENFRTLIDELTANQINSIRRVSKVPAVQRAFRFFDEDNTSAELLTQQLKSEFREDHCLTVNSEEERKNYQILINTLEDKGNRIRAIFAVQQLNEGWDVLNLFDIVRCYETRDSGKTTTSEAQLIGRGARYFHFVLPDYPDRFRRKFDENPDHDLRVLEELHYHSMHNPRYISEIRSALIDKGMMDIKERESREIKLKNKFKETDFYKKGVVWLNKRVKKNYSHIQSFEDLGVKKKDYPHQIATGQGGTITALKNQNITIVSDENSEDLPVKDIEMNIVKAAIARNPFFTFASISRYFPQLTSIREFITSEDYLRGLTINLQGNINGLGINRSEKLAACCGLLGQIESDIREQITEYEGTTQFYEEFVHAIFTDKRLEFSPDTLKSKEDPQFTHFVSVKDWFAFDTLYGTSAERAFVRLLDRWIKDTEKDYEIIYLLRNEGHFSLYNFSDGQGFQPDFVLFLREKNGNALSYQLFIEPKGEHIADGDRWKEEFLQEICTEYQSKVLTENSKYRIIGVPSFYNKTHENQFREDLDNALKTVPQISEQDG